MNEQWPSYGLSLSWSLEWGIVVNGELSWLDPRRVYTDWLGRYFARIWILIILIRAKK